MNYSADGKQVAPLERAMRLSEQVIRYMTLKLPAKKATEKTEATPVKELATAEA